ncbi:uncharacterized protein LOC131176514 [Hevea brasiliensis]|uniref:uncharacterized protein LOC131176514 n=1 Tax=Hevea brasiliensis TaxID=3981 RepID=UPI0025EDC1EF|nr:uncharacterized protein LOC131176514 [Hevea brasiliensis]
MASSGFGSSSSSKGKSKVGESTYPNPNELTAVDLDNIMEQIGDDDNDVEVQELFHHTQESQNQQAEKVEVKKALTSDIFKVHFTKKRRSENTFDVICNYCGQVYKFKMGGGYGTFNRHLEQKHPTKIGQQLVSQSQPSSQVQNEPTSRISMGDRALLQRQKRPRGSLGNNSEFDIYLTTIFEFGDNSAGKEFPVLDWWRRHANTFPTLALIAKQILAAPVSTVAVEQAFSAGGSILDETRSNMVPESLEAQTCLDDWIKAALRQQEITREGNEDLYDIGTDGTTTESSGCGSD